MKVVNVKVDGTMYISSIYDTDNQTSHTVNSAFKVPTGNYKNIILDFDFISPSADQEGLHLFATFKADYMENPVEVEITDFEAEGNQYTKACYLPNEVLQKTGQVTLGVYGYILSEDDTLKKRVSLNPISHDVIMGSYDENASTIIVPTPTIFEVYFNEVNQANAQMQSNLEEYESILEEKLLFYKKYESNYSALEDEQIIPINIEQFSVACNLIVDKNGLLLIENTDYTIDYENKSIELTTPIETNASNIHFIVLKTAIVNNEDYDFLKGEKGDSGIIRETLFEDTEGTSNTITLTKSIIGFDKIEVQDISGKIHEYTANNGEKTIIMEKVVYSEPNEKLRTFFANLTFQNNSISFGTQYFYDTDGYNQQFDNGIKINKVIGYKF